MSIILPVNIETASTEKRFHVNVYQMSSQFIQQIVSLIGKYRLIRISLCVKCSIAVELRGLDSSIFLAWLEGSMNLGNSGGEAKNILWCLRT